jgi:hypothetical protein
VRFAAGGRALAPRRLPWRIGRPAILAAALAAAASAHAACTDLAAAPNSRWSLAAANGVSWLVTPCGERFFSLGVNVLEGGDNERLAMGKRYAGYDWRNFAPSIGEWAAETRGRLLRWGFNSAGAWSIAPQTLKLPTIIDLELGRRARFHWFDPFAPATAARMQVLARRLTAPYRNSPYRIGYFSDNEVGWWAGALFVFYSMKPASSATKQRWVESLEHYYRGEWAGFAADFVPPRGVRSWDGLLKATGMTRMRPGGGGIHAVRQWAGILAHRYYRLAAAAIRAADPAALYFGDRLPIYYDPAAVRAMVPYVDAIATNYNVDSSDGWIAPYYFEGLRQLSGGKPVLVSEWFFAARRNRSGNRNNGHLMTVETQRLRAAGAAAALRNFAAIPQLVGAHWFQYFDDPRGGRADGEDYDFGLVDIHDRPYRRLTAALAEANRQAVEIHARSAAPPTPAAATFVVPHAAIDLAERSLADWPKPASLLPPLSPSPGAVPFGEVYLSWSNRGLALATIGQDYFDIDLLAYAGRFPLTDAYRVELGVDLGNGPRRFTLFFIPPRTKRHDYPEMRAELCEGGAVVAIRAGCTPVAGADAVYFGADQPRITAEMKIPWGALGVSAPAAGQSLRAEVAVTSWDGDRWMTLSGLAPATAMDQPAGWRAMRLGDGGRMIETEPPPSGRAPG